MLNAEMGAGLKLILEKNILVGENYKDWLRNVKLVLSLEKIAYVLDGSKPKEPDGKTSEEDRMYFNDWVKDAEMARCYVLASMSNELQRKHEHMDVQSMLLNTKELYGENSRAEMYSVTSNLWHTKMEGGPVRDHVLKMIGYVEDANRLGFVLVHEMSTDIILNSLDPAFDPFITNFIMNKTDVELPELLNMLHQFEQRIKPAPVLVVGTSSSSKPKGKSWKKKVTKPGQASKDKLKVVQKVVTKQKGAASDAECFHCHKTGHWKRNCKLYQAELAKKKEAPSSGIH